MNQFDNSERITLTSKTSALLSNEKISLSTSNPSIQSTIDSSVLIPNSLNSNLSHSLPSSPALHAPNLLGVVPLASTLIKDKIVVSTSSESESNSNKSELVSEPTQAKNQLKRPLVAYEEEDSKGSSPEPQPSTSNSEKEEVTENSKEDLEEAKSLSEAAALRSAPVDAAVEEQKPSTSSASSAEASSAEQPPKPKTKRVRISLKLDQLSVLRLERLASENPKLLRKLGLKAYRIKNFNGSSKRFQIIREPAPVSRPSNPSQVRGVRRPSRGPSSSSIAGSFPTASPTPRFRAPYPHQRNISAFEYSKGGPPGTPGFPMDRTQQLQPQQQQFQYPAQYPQQPQAPNQQYPAAQPQTRPPPSMPPQQQQSQQQQGQPQQVRSHPVQEPGPSNNCSDSPLLVGLLSNNSQQPPPNQPQTRYPQTPQQAQQMAQQHPMMPVQHQGYPPQHMQPQNMHMIQQQQYQYPPQRMPGTGQHHVGPGGALQPMAGQPHMLTPQGMPPQAQQPVPEPPAPKKRKSRGKKQKEEQAKAEAAAAAAAEQQRKAMMMQQQIPNMQQDYYMMQRMQNQNMQQQRMPPGYSPYQGYPPGQQPSTSMVPPGYPQHGYPPQQQPMWQPHDYQSQYQMQMMRPPGHTQNPGTPTSSYPPPHQSPGYPPTAAGQQQQKIRTPSYPQPSPQYSGQNPQQHPLSRQFMSPQNHASPGYQQPSQQNQFGYPQPTPPQQQGQPGQVNQTRPGHPMPPNAQQQQNTSGNLEDYGSFSDYPGPSLEDLAATFGDCGDECDLDSITPMNTDTVMPQQQHPQHGGMIQSSQQAMHQQTQHNPQQQQQPPPPYDQQQHQFMQQSPMGPPQGYHPGHGYPQMAPQDVPGHFHRPPSAGQQAHMPMYMHHPQQVQQQQAQQQQLQQQQQQVQPPINDQPPNGSVEDGFSTVYDAPCSSPPKANQEQQRNIQTSVDFVFTKVRKDDKEYFDSVLTRWNNNPNGNDAPPASATKRKSKSTSSRPPSRQPKNSQPSSAAATPTSTLGPFFSANSTGTEPSTPNKEETAEFKHERKSSTLSSLLSGSSTPTIKFEENGHSELSTALMAPVKTESRDTETPQSITSGNTDTEHTRPSTSPTTNPPVADAGVLKVEGNGNNLGLYNGHLITTSPPTSNDAVALKTKQEHFSSNISLTAESIHNAHMPPPRKIRKTDSSPTGVDDVFYPGESVDLSTATS